MKQREKGYMKKYKNNYGAVSIYLCLLLAVVLSVLLIVVEAARVNAMQTQIECSADLAMDSCLAEYHRELLNRYDLLFIDTSYGENEGSIEKLNSHLTNYMTYNLSPQKDTLLSLGSSDLLGLSVDEVDILRASRATDNNGEVYRYMATSYMKEHYGIAYLDDIKDMTEYCESNNLFTEDMQQESDDALDDYYNFDTSNAEEEGAFIDFDASDAADEISSLSGLSVLDIYDIQVSDKSHNLSNVTSNRDLVSGDGLSPNYTMGSSLEEQLLFNEYILLEFGNYTDVKEGSALDYELEYIIAGKNNDRDNLSNVCFTLVNMRAVANMAAISNNIELQGEIEATAVAIATAVCFPPIEPVIKIVLQTGICYGEAICDVRVLLDGGRVPLMKGPGDWNLTLSSFIANALGSLTGVETARHEVGLNYKEYLRLILYFTSQDTKTFRSMDVIEMDIRNITGEETFRLDDCVCSCDVQMIVSSSYGYACFLKRTFEYH